MCVCLLPFMYIDYTKGEGLSDLIGETDSVLQMKKSMFKNERYHEIVKKELPRLLEMGFMEILQY
jgi:argonaute-like protein implicated in RNA metabolism and viral defense